MAVSNWSTTAAQNTAINGINIAEGCHPGNLNNAIRQIMADVRVRFDGVGTSEGYVTKSGGVFTTNPTYQGRGGYLHNNDPTSPGGRVFVQPLGGSVPAMSNGDLLIEY